ncbi:uncharacterized protein LOC143222969 isoform X2 [Tachypleus tridentatus]|uniref:uncharacterized protein LOC143222969 isoform X2 n=1 Tax=Tachypleus tridentatus TaxID=6853 RepID=UPI003FD14554
MAAVSVKWSSLLQIGDLKLGEPVCDEYARKMYKKFPIKFASCHACCGFYGPCFGQPLCATCHAFLCPENINQLDVIQLFQEKSDSEDSGNEEPADFYEILPYKPGEKPKISLSVPKVDRLSDCISALTCPKQLAIVPEGLAEHLPAEVLALVFSYLDDLSLWSCGQVCKRWNQILETETTDDHWYLALRKRWPLFITVFKNPHWRMLYTKLVESTPCIICLHQIAEQIQLGPGDDSWRAKRLRNELKSLQADPPEGIEATPMDRMCCHWQASIMGPAESPYEGGFFFLYLQIPSSYPMKPPVVRFITKVFHPNVSRHGDIGLDSITHNWSLALTISKVLISIQSLLTDPYCYVCMEPEVGKLYIEDRKSFERTARFWTGKYAMHHKLACSVDTDACGRALESG